MRQRTRAWPTLDHDELAPMVGYVNRVVQVAGKYTLDAPFEVGWGNTVLDVTPRWGLRTPTSRQRGVAFTVHYRLTGCDALRVCRASGLRSPRRQGLEPLAGPRTPACCCPACVVPGGWGGG
ncbi:DUF5996 family protein [Streptomyces cyaneofuscatus]|uniref:DUF5996 family protein n=1 Tax=Streptomyces cyaneofuscatus TaxID=66883 RepID=UPI00382D47D3